MTNDNPDDNKYKRSDVFENLEERFLQSLAKTREDFRKTAERFPQDIREKISNPARTHINHVRRTTRELTEEFTNTVGPDRIKGALLGAKIAGTFVGLRTLHPLPTFIATAAGAAAGFIGGRKFYNWLDAEQTGEQPPVNENSPPHDSGTMKQGEPGASSDTPSRKPRAFRIDPEP